MKISEKKLFDFIKSNDREVFEDQSTYSNPTLHYFKREHKHDRKFFASWNWAAFFFNGTWLIFRKMYLYAFLFPIVFSLVFTFFTMILLSILIPLSIDIETPLFILFSIMFLLTTFILPIFGDSLYLQFAKKEIQRGKSNKKGVTWLGGILSFFFYSYYFIIPVGVCAAFLVQFANFLGK